jgi:hypothetical protein
MARVHVRACGSSDGLRPETEGSNRKLELLPGWGSVGVLRGRPGPMERRLSRGRRARRDRHYLAHGLCAAPVWGTASVYVDGYGLAVTGTEMELPQAEPGFLTQNEAELADP